jgi:hypothetical protein
MLAAKHTSATPTISGGNRALLKELPNIASKTNA